MKTTPAHLASILQNINDGHIFSVDFIKKDGTLRRMVCRLGVKAYLKGGKPAYSFEEKRLVPVFDMQKQGYRSISLDRIVKINVNGQTYERAE